MDDIIRDSHIGRASDKVKNKWLDTLNTYGIRPVRLEAISNTNKDDINELNILKDAPLVREAWEFIKDLGRYTRKDSCELICQKEEEMIVILIKFSTQKVGEGSLEKRDLVAGSKEEKMSVNIKI